jgi:hypothetical protein
MVNFYDDDNKKSKSQNKSQNENIEENQEDGNSQNNPNYDPNNDEPTDEDKKRKRKVITTGIIGLALASLLGYTAYKLASKNGETEDEKIASIEEPAQDEDMVDEEMEEEERKPEFGTVRMKNGDVLISGRAKPDSEVTILDGGRRGKELAEVETDEDGEWVYIEEDALKPGRHVLSVYTKNDEGERIYSEQDYVFNVAEEGKDEEEFAVSIGGNKDSRVLQEPKTPYTGEFRVVKVDYNEIGSIRVDGYGKKYHRIALYLDNKFVGKKYTKKETGKWFIRFNKKIQSGKEYTLRADMINKTGKVVSRVEYSFKPTILPKSDENDLYVVKKGDNLWNIAKWNYGSGFDYVVIYKANKSQIKDPDLIYENQVFLLPENKEMDIENQ